MYVLASQLKHLPVLSLQTGHVLALVDDLILNPDQMEVFAMMCRTGRSKRTALITQDIRQLHTHNAIVNNEDDLCDPDEIVRLKQLLARKFRLINLPAVTESGRKLGRVRDYTINTETFLVKKIHIKSTLWHSFIIGDLIIDRNQIVEVTPRHLIVRDTTIKQPLLSPRSTPAVD